MNAIQITKPFDMGTTVLPYPEVQSGEILLRTRYVGFCGSDLNTFRGGNSMVTYPRIPGHEIGAVIEDIGENVPDSFLKGQTVTVNPYTNCGHCASCRNGRVNACENNETLGVQRDGAMREFISLPWQKVIPADSVSCRAAALVEPLSVGFHAVDRGGVTDSDIVMVIGCGMVGLGSVIRSVARGATVIAADVDDEKLSVAKELGANHTYNTLKEWGSLPDPDVVIEAVGATPTYQLAINKVAFTGRVVCIGYAKSDIALTTSLIVKKELDIRGSRNANPKDFEAAIKYVEKHPDMIDRFVSAETTPEHALEAMRQWHDNPGKVFRILVRF